MAAALAWADRRFRLGHGRVLFAYPALYGTGRFFSEFLLTDTQTLVLGMRWNQLAALAVRVLAVVAFALSARFRPGREQVVEHVGGGEYVCGGRGEARPPLS